ncbi:MAG: L-ribulose-5-phosphate 4-epimerase AraD [Acholeplasmatales bacterium]|jgi:L-ribulose-5-phosphate 4-epimerase|nr:L-ribulose-5-phosphate 4-epimerase AraD [Acholeplasmatales bacterium]
MENYQEIINELRKNVLEANLNLVKYGLVILTWGNVSEIDKSRKYVAIKPSGVPYSKMVLDDIVVTDLEGNVIVGNLKPSSDLQTHLEIYKKYPNVSGICHTHSKWATIFSQANRSIKVLGTTHSDYFSKDVETTRLLTELEVKSNYEKNTGKVILEKIGENNPLDCPAILVAGHAPFTFGHDALNSVENALVLENVAEMAYYTLELNSDVVFPKYVLDCHYNRKHGKNAYYGQKTSK